MLDPESLRHAAARAAECCRVVTDLRRQKRYLQKLMDVTIPLDDDTAVDDDASFEDLPSIQAIEASLSQAEQAFSDSFALIVDVIHKRAFDASKRAQLSDSDADDFAQDTVMHVMAKIGQFDGRAFLGWLRTVVYRLLVSGFRRSTVDVIDYDWNQWGEESGDDLTARPIDHQAISKAVADFVALRSPKSEYQYLFIVASQLWQFVEGELQMEWEKQFRQPSDWEQQELTSLWRCNQIALDWSDRAAPSNLSDEFTDLGMRHDPLGLSAAVSLEHQEAIYDKCLTKTCQNIAQTLTRHYAVLMEAPAIHDYLFRDVPLVDVQLEESDIPDRREFAILLQFNAWVGLSGAIWERWRHHHQLNNATHRNLGRLFSMPGAVTKNNSEERHGQPREQGLNNEKLSVIIDWLESAEFEPGSVEDSEVEDVCWEATDTLGTLSELRFPILRLVRSAAGAQQRIDLPIPFHKLSIDETLRFRKTSE